MSPIQIDIYRSETSILVHWSRRKRKRRPIRFIEYAVFGMWGFMILCFSIANIWLGVAIAVFLTLPILLQLSSITTFETIRINQGIVRNDRRSRLGVRFSKRRQRETDLSVTWSKQSAKRRDFFSVHVQNGDQSISLPIVSNTQAKWIVEQIQQFLDDVSCKEKTEENLPLPKARWNDTDSGSSLLETLEWQGRPFQRLPSWMETADANTTTVPEQGVLRIRCEKCRKLIPEDCVHAETAFCGCPDCRVLYEIPSLKRWPPSRWMRAKISQSGETLRIRQSLLSWSPLPWLAMLFTLGVVGGFLWACLHIYINAQKTLSPEQLHEYLYRSLGTSGVNVMTIFIVIAALFITLLLIALALFLYRYHLEITPETCCFVEKSIFWRRKTVIPRTDVQKYIASQQGSGGLVYRDGIFLLEEGIRLQGIINHFLLTVPPKEREPFDTDDFSIENSFVGGEESDCIRVDLVDTASGSLLPFENALNESGKELRPDRIMIRSPEGCIGSTGRITFEKTESTFRIEVAEETSKESLILAWIPAIFISLLFGMIVVIAAVGLIKALFFRVTLPPGDFPAMVFALTVFGSVTLFVWMAAWDGFRSLKSSWKMTIDAEKLKLVRRFRHWEDSQTLDRKEILAAECSGGGFFTLLSRLPSLLHAGPVVLRLRDGQIFNLPRFPSSYDKTFSQGLANELNEFLLDK